MPFLFTVHTCKQNPFVTLYAVVGSVHNGMKLHLQYEDINMEEFSWIYRVHEDKRSFQMNSSHNGVENT